LAQGCTNPEPQFALITKFCTLVPIICGAFVRYLLPVSLLAPRIFMCIGNSRIAAVCNMNATFVVTVLSRVFLKGDVKLCLSDCEGTSKLNLLCLHTLCSTHHNFNGVSCQELHISSLRITVQPCTCLLTKKIEI